MTPAGIAISLTEAENTHQKGEDFWNRQTIRQILMNPSYKGEWNFKEYIIPMPVIIEPEMWNKPKNTARVYKELEAKPKDNTC